MHQMQTAAPAKQAPVVRTVVSKPGKEHAPAQGNEPAPKPGQVSEETRRQIEAAISRPDFAGFTVHEGGRILPFYRTRTA